MNRITSLASVMKKLDVIGARMKKHGSAVLDDPDFQRQTILILQRHRGISTFTPPSKSSPPEVYREALVQSLMDLREAAKSKLASIPLKLSVAQEIQRWNEACESVKSKISVVTLRLGGDTKSKVQDLKTEANLLVDQGNTMLAAAAKKHRGDATQSTRLPRFLARAIHSRTNELLESVDCLDKMGRPSYSFSPPLVKYLEPLTLSKRCKIEGESSTNPFEGLPPDVSSSCRRRRRRGHQNLSLSSRK